MSMNIPDEAYRAADKAVDELLIERGANLNQPRHGDVAVNAAAPHIQAPLLARIAELEAKLAESERIAGVLREQRNKAEDELRERA